ncbi:hypothetical protein ACVGWX_00140, partial [Enterobacter hormaechei]
LIGTSGSILWWQGQQITDNYTHLRQQEDTLAKITPRPGGVRYQYTSHARSLLIIPPGIKPQPNPNNIYIIKKTHPTKISEISVMRYYL